jgi:hypothetical protein
MARPNGRDFFLIILLTIFKRRIGIYDKLETTGGCHEEYRNKTCLPSHAGDHRRDGRQWFSQYLLPKE